MIEHVVVTRHKALAALLVERGVVPPEAVVLEHVTEADVRGKHVVGVLPNHLASLAASLTEIPLKLAPEQRGRELDLEELRKVAGEPVTYRIFCEEESYCDSCLKAGLLAGLSRYEARRAAKRRFDELDGWGCSSPACQY